MENQTFINAYGRYAGEATLAYVLMQRPKSTARSRIGDRQDQWRFLIATDVTQFISDCDPKIARTIPDFKKRAADIHAQLIDIPQGEQNIYITALQGIFEKSRQTAMAIMDKMIPGGITPALEKTIDELNISTNAGNSITKELKRLGIQIPRVRDLLENIPVNDLKVAAGIGPKHFNEIREALAAYALTLKGDECYIA